MCGPDIFYIYLHSPQFNSASSADRNETVQWQRRFRCLSVIAVEQQLKLCVRIKINDSGGW